MTTNELNKKIRLITKIGVLFHKYGANAQRLEASLNHIASHLDLVGNFFSTPTYLVISIEGDDEQINNHVRVTPGDTNLSSLQDVDSLVDQLCNGDISVDDCIRQLNFIQMSPFRYNGFLQVLSFMATSLSLSIILKGGHQDVLWSSILGSIVGILSYFKQFNRKVSEIFEFLSAFLVMIGCFLASEYFDDFNYQIVLISALIVIIPGLGLTTAMNELASQNLASGTARLMGALIDLFKISFGALLGLEVGKLYFTKMSLAETSPLPEIMIIPALLLASLSFTIIFNARLKDFGIVMLSGVISLGTLYFYQLHLTQVISIFLASFSIALASNLFANLANKPAAVMLVPGIIFLVPGSVGLKGLNLIMQAEYIAGLTTGLQMFIISITIVAGMFLANIVLTPKKNL